MGTCQDSSPGTSETTNAEGCVGFWIQCPGENSPFGHFQLTRRGRGIVSHSDFRSKGHDKHPSTRITGISRNSMFAEKNGAGAYIEPCAVLMVSTCMGEDFDSRAEAAVAQMSGTSNTCGTPRCCREALLWTYTNSPVESRTAG